MRLRRSAGLAVAATALAGLPAVGAADVSSDPVPAVSRAARERLLDRVVESDRLVERLRERFGRRLGPTYYADSPAGPVYTVGIVGRTGADTRAVRELAAVPGLVDVRTARHTTGEMLGFADRVAARLDATGVRYASVGIGMPLLPERVVVTSEAPLGAAVREELRALVPVRLDFGAGTPATPVHQTSRSDYPPYEAALALRLLYLRLTPTASARTTSCTSGFVGYSPVTRRYFGTTAGHCAREGAVVFSGNATQLGEIDENGYHDSNDDGVVDDDDRFVDADAARFPIRKADVTTRIARGVQSHLTVNGRYDSAGLLTRVGKRMCWVGETSDVERCGTLMAPTNVDQVGVPELGTPARTLRRVFCIRMPLGQGPPGGDSGAPVYDLNKADGTAIAAGLVSAHLVFRDADGVPEAAGSCFQPLERVEARLGLEILFEGWADPNAQSDGSSWSPAPSGDGRFVAFSSAASNLVDSDTNGVMDVFVRDKASQVTERVSVSSTEQQANGASGFLAPPAVSDDGRYVLFQSEATNLVAGDTNGLRDVFVRDRQNGTTTRVSVSSSGQQATGGAAGAWPGEISAGGRFVTFASNATNLVAGGNPNGHQHVYRRDLLTGTTEVVSAGLAGQQANSSSVGGPVSTDGRYVAFFSYAQNLVPGQTGDPNLDVDVFVRDMVDDTTVMVSMTPGGMRGNANSGDDIDMSDDGRYVVFESYASNLVSGDTNGEPDVFAHDRLTGLTERASVSTAGAQANSWSSGARVSGNGRYVAFTSLASNLVPGDTNGLEDVFLHDLTTGTTRRMSLGSSGQQQRALGDPDDFALGGIGISANGNHVAFSTESRLVPGDTQSFHDVYQRNWPANLTILVSQP